MPICALLGFSPVSHLQRRPSSLRAMCYAAGSIDAVNPCPMCKVFPHSRCPHVRDTCRNRAHHPRMDVVYIKNAEVDRFNGCGYCKWAKMTPTPPPDFLRYNNPGWPGCCRPPFPTEYSSIPAADWRAVSAVHNVPIPPNIQAVLDTLASRGPGLPPFSPTSPSGRASARPGSDRKNTGNSSPSSKASTLSKATNGKARSSGSPQTATATLSRTSSGGAVSSSAPSSPSSPEEKERERGHHTPRNGVDTPKRRIDSSNSSPNRRDMELEKPSPPTSRAPSRTPGSRRPTVTTPATTSVSVSKVVAHSPSALGGSSARRRSSVTRPERREQSSVPSTTSPLRSAPAPAPPPSARPSSLVIPNIVSRANDDNLSSASSSSGSSDGQGNFSDSTVTSDGGFTDYLSDESEAELQRQAEAKAALVALNAQEELEFKAARLQLASVDLRPPKTWNPANITHSRFGIPKDTLGAGAPTRVGHTARS